MQKQLVQENLVPLQQSVNEQIPLPKEMLALIIMHLDPLTLWDFLHSHRFAYWMMHDSKDLQRRYFQQHVTTSEMTLQQIQILPSDYHASGIGGFAHHLLRAGQFWSRIPKPATFWTYLESFFSTPPNLEDEWLDLLNAALENYDVFLKFILPKFDYRKALAAKSHLALTLLNQTALHDHLECFRLLYENIDSIVANTLSSNCFDFGHLQRYSGITNYVNSAIVSTLPSTCNKRVKAIDDADAKSSSKPSIECNFKR